VKADPSPASLTEAQIEQLVQRYKLEMARYEGAARFVEQRLRRERVVSSSGEVQRQLRDVLNATRRLDDLVARLASSRAREIESSKRVLDTSEALRFALEPAIDRPLRGEIERLHRLLSSAIAPLTAHSLAELDIRAALARGHQVAQNLLRAENDNVDDVVALALGLATKFGKKFRDLASQWRGPSTTLKRAILEATR
jgi:hypothetical protein